MHYQLYYWPTIQGRGEFVRLALEEAQVPYTDVARGKNGVDKLIKKMAQGPTPSYAPPFLVAGEQTLGQVANILQFIGGAHGLAPRAQRGRLWVNQLQLTIADVVAEAHDTHHPISVDLTYEAQSGAAKKRAAAFVNGRIPKFLDYFEGVLALAGKGGYLLGSRLSYADLSLFQLVEGLRYAFPAAMARLDGEHPRLLQLCAQVAARPALARYLNSKRRIPFNEEGIFRHYAALDR
ncbi:glutathione S-transferase [Massilia sp. PWRC2]|uniref:glutathione S-transferase n=1 Tax=Massilia sp. PWRC2 TaxID=2804626 RepID=UPI003CEC4494